MKKRIFALLTVICLFCCCTPIASAYSNDELCNMARQYYKSKWKQEPPLVQIDREEAGEVTIHLYEVTQGHTATWDWYTINRVTGKGKDFSGGDVDLTPYASSAPANSGLPFQDVPQSEWYYESIRYVYENGLFSGTTPSTFNPSGTLNRGMLVTVLYRLEGKPTVYNSTNFQDVSITAYYGDAVAWASLRGIANGTTATTFSPQAPLTHEQLAVFLYRYAVLYLGMNTSSTASLNAYPDGGEVGTYAQKAMQWCISNGMIHGNSLSPKSNATRAEAAFMLHQLSKQSSTTGGYKRIMEPILANGGKCLTTDLDGDGQNELLTLYVDDMYQKMGIYTYNNGKVSTLTNETFFMLVAGQWGEVGVVAKNGTTYLCVHFEDPRSNYPEEHFVGYYKLYQLSNAKLTSMQTVEYDLTYWSGENPPLDYKPKGSATLSGASTGSMNPSEFEAWEKSLVWKAKISAK